MRKILTGSRDLPAHVAVTGTSRQNHPARRGLIIECGGGEGKGTGMKDETRRAKDVRIPNDGKQYLRGRGERGYSRDRWKKQPQALASRPAGDDSRY